MVTKLEVNKKVSDAYGSRLEIRINTENGKAIIGGIKFEFKDYKMIEGPEFRDGKYPSVKIVYDISKRSALEKDVSKIKGLAELCLSNFCVSGELEEPHPMSNFLDLVFPEGSFILIGNSDEIFSMQYA